MLTCVRMGESGTEEGGRLGSAGGGMGAYDAWVGAACQMRKAYERQKPAESTRPRHLPLISMKQTVVRVCIDHVCQQSG